MNPYDFSTDNCHYLDQSGEIDYGNKTKHDALFCAHDPDQLTKMKQILRRLSILWEFKIQQEKEGIIDSNQNFTVKYLPAKKDWIITMDYFDGDIYFPDFYAMEIMKYMKENYPNGVIEW